MDLVKIWKDEGTLVGIVDMAGNVNAARCGIRYLLSFIRIPLRLVYNEAEDTEFPCPRGCMFHLYGLSSNVRTPSHRDDTSFIHVTHFRTIFALFLRFSLGQSMGRTVLVAIDNATCALTPLISQSWSAEITAVSQSKTNIWL